MADTLLSVTLVAFYRSSDNNLNVVISSIVKGYLELDQEARKLVKGFNLPSFQFNHIKEIFVKE